MELLAIFWILLPIFSLFLVVPSSPRSTSSNSGREELELNTVFCFYTFSCTTPSTTTALSIVSAVAIALLHNSRKHGRCTGPHTGPDPTASRCSTTAAGFFLFSLCISLGSRSTILRIVPTSPQDVFQETSRLRTFLHWWSHRSYSRRLASLCYPQRGSGCGRGQHRQRRAKDRR